jgi:predicted 3-demethylubiquinone-9 3-methyltransferase (glyoxalase superfamily)
MQKITPFLWFENQAEAAAKFYASMFKKSKILNVARYTEAGAKVSGRPKNSVMTVAFEIAGQKFIALNGGPQFKFNEAISFVVSCRTQKEIDYYSKTLSAGGEEAQCGWLKDKFGVSWQIVPDLLDELMSGDPAKSQRVMQALLQMKKLDIKKLKEAAKRKEQA